VIALTVVVFVLYQSSRDLRETLLNAFAQGNFLVERGDWWRIFTPILLHGSAAHIAFNMYALFQLGPAVEVRYGKLNFLLLYLASAAAGGAFAFHLGDTNDVLVGASGAIFGLFGLWLDIAYRQRETAFGRSLLSSLWISLALNIALPFFIPGISWQGHLGGFVAGILIGEFWARAPRQLYWMTPVAVAVTAVASVFI
jgi:membrane associated rhomboid family serine protease